MVAEDTLQPGETIADYRIDKVLGAGSFGVTYLAHDIHLARGVAIKEYMPVDYARRSAGGAVSSRNNETAPTFEWGLARFSEEARTLAQFNHPNIVKVQRLVQSVNGTAYIVMELLEGTNLETVVEQQGPLEPDVFIAVFRQILDGMEAVHAIGILHRDIKPANIVIKGQTPVLIDFGAARDLALQRKAGFSALVTDGFSPPEQYSREKEQNEASDIYALAATAYYLLSGKTPPPAVARMVGDSMPPFTEIAADKLAEDILKALDWALNLKVEERPQSIALWRAAMPSLAEAQVKPEIIIVEKPGGLPINRRALLIAGAGVVVAGTAAVLLIGRDSAISGSARPLKAQWQKTVAKMYGDPFADIRATATGAMIAAHRLDDGGNERALALRVDDQGNITGDYALDQPGSRAHTILPATDGGAFVGGEIGDQAMVMRLDANWRPVWSKRYEPGSISSLLSNGDGFVAGLEGPDSSGMAKLLFMDAAGSQQSDVTLLDRKGDTIQQVIQLADGSLGVLGWRKEERLVNGAKRDTDSLWVARVSKGGEEVWRQGDSGLGNANGWGIVEAGGNIFVVGRTSPDGQDANSRLLVVRWSADGKKIWSRSDYPGLPSSGRGIATDGAASPRVYLSGWSGSKRRTRLSQIDPDGNLIWDDLAPEGASYSNSAMRVALRADGTGFAVGATSQTESDLSLTVSRLA